MIDKIMHKAYKADVLYRPTPSDIRCRKCGTRLKAYYCEDMYTVEHWNDCNRKFNR